MKRYFALYISMVALLAGCFKTRAQLREDLEDPTPQRQTVVQQQQQQRAPVRPAPSTNASRFEEYDEQLRNLNGRIETVENSLGAGQQADKQNQIRERAQLEQKFVAYEEELKKLEAQVSSLSEEVARLKAPPPPPLPAAEAKPTTPGKGGRTHFEEGEEHFGNKKWKEAIVAYQKYRDNYPRGRSYGDATYKIGVSFQELGLKDEAKSFFEEVTAKFPGSKEAKKAAIRLKSLK